MSNKRNYLNKYLVYYVNFRSFSSTFRNLDFFYPDEIVVDTTTKNVIEYKYNFNREDKFIPTKSQINKIAKEILDFIDSLNIANRRKSNCYFVYDNEQISIVIYYSKFKIYIRIIDFINKNVADDYFEYVINLIVDDIESEREKDKYTKLELLEKLKNNNAKLYIDNNFSIVPVYYIIKKISEEYSLFGKTQYDKLYNVKIYDCFYIKNENLLTNKFRINPYLFIDVYKHFNIFRINEAVKIKIKYNRFEKFKNKCYNVLYKFISFIKKIIYNE